MAKRPAQGEWMPLKFRGGPYLTYLTFTIPLSQPPVRYLTVLARIFSDFLK